MTALAFARGASFANHRHHHWAEHHQAGAGGGSRGHGTCTHAAATRTCNMEALILQAGDRQALCLEPRRPAQGKRANEKQQRNASPVPITGGFHKFAFNKQA
ncbi:hypothetical protein H0G86_001794 [Trichoderma simmonsii]|uniref:Uncharacterized protein n=1 Tax=Trichoderma simmonsii TaxID=1491479 RepID=A0A8G0L781_9HYPO|nr:hypothetical protein H0G86_001794 [Trichoderma simmonsii]